MSSQEKTQGFGLCQWGATDAVRMEDFNRDNRLIDAALSARPAAQVRLVSGPAQVRTDFAPRAVLMLRPGPLGQENASGGLALPGQPAGGISVLPDGYALTQPGLYLCIAFA